MFEKKSFREAGRARCGKRQPPRLPFRFYFPMDASIDAMLAGAAEKQT
jgi:hypothetical protein